MINTKRIRIGKHYLYSSAAPGFRLPKDHLYKSIREILTNFVKEIRQKDINLVIILMPDYEMEHYYGIDLVQFYKDHGISAINFPIGDMDVPGSLKSFENLETYLSRKIKRLNILVHCAGGSGRTGIVIVGLLMRLGKTYNEALSLARTANPKFVESIWQELFLQDYEDELGT